MYGTAQFKLDRTRVQHRPDTTCFSFRTHSSMRARAHEIDDVKPTVQINRVCTRHVHDSLQMHTYMSEKKSPNLDYVCMQIVSQGQRNRLYKHVHVLHC